MKINNNKGFSLVELSIVLIVIALLVSGVIGGRSLINNSKINLINSEFNTIKIAIRSYINNNDLRTYTTEQINFDKLVEDGYLDENSLFSSELTSATPSEKKYIGYPSKISDASWYYDYSTQNETYILTLSSSKWGFGILDERLCNQFVNRYNTNTKILEVNCTLADNLKYMLELTVHDILN